MKILLLILLFTCGYLSCVRGVVEGRTPPLRSTTTGDETSTSEESEIENDGKATEGNAVGESSSSPASRSVGASRYNRSPSSSDGPEGHRRNQHRRDAPSVRHHSAPDLLQETDDLSEADPQGDRPSDQNRCGSLDTELENCHIEISGDFPLQTAIPGTYTQNGDDLVDGRPWYGPNNILYLYYYEEYDNWQISDHLGGPYAAAYAPSTNSYFPFQDDLEWYLWNGRDSEWVEAEDVINIECLSGGRYGLPPPGKLLSIEIGSSYPQNEMQMKLLQEEQGDPTSNGSKEHRRNREEEECSTVEITVETGTEESTVTVERTVERTPEDCEDDEDWESAWGDCESYEEGESNHEFCTVDSGTSDRDEIDAIDACPVACGTCSSPSECSDDPDWSSRYGDCESYSDGEFNHQFCGNDVGTDDVEVSVACPEACGTCGEITETETESAPTTEDCEDDLDWESRYGDCESYGEEEINHDFCMTDIGTTGNSEKQAFLACPFSCDVCDEKAVESDCDVRVSGSFFYQTGINGEYDFNGNLWNGRPYYGPFYDLYLYYYEDYDNWHISDNLGDNFASAYAPDEGGYYPWEVPLEWYVWDSYNSQWMQDDEIMVSCAFASDGTGLVGDPRDNSLLSVGDRRSIWEADEDDINLVKGAARADDPNATGGNRRQRGSAEGEGGSNSSNIEAPREGWPPRGGNGPARGENEPARGDGARNTRNRGDPREGRGGQRDRDGGMNGVERGDDRSYGRTDAGPARGDRGSSRGDPRESGFAEGEGSNLGNREAAGEGWPARGETGSTRGEGGRARGDGARNTSNRGDSSEERGGQSDRYDGMNGVERGGDRNYGRTDAESTRGDGGPSRGDGSRNANNRGDPRERGSAEGEGEGTNFSNREAPREGWPARGENGGENGPARGEARSARGEGRHARGDGARNTSNRGDPNEGRGGQSDRDGGLNGVGGGDRNYGRTDAGSARGDGGPSRGDGSRSGNNGGYLGERGSAEGEGEGSSFNNREAPREGWPARGENGGEKEPARGETGSTREGGRARGDGARNTRNRGDANEERSGQSDRDGGMNGVERGGDRNYGRTDAESARGDGGSSRGDGSRNASNRGGLRESGSVEGEGTNFSHREAAGEGWPARGENGPTRGDGARNTPNRGDRREERGGQRDRDGGMNGVERNGGRDFGETDVRSARGERDPSRGDGARNASNRGGSTEERGGQRDRDGEMNATQRGGDRNYPYPPTPSLGGPRASADPRASAGPRDQDLQRGPPGDQRGHPIGPPGHPRDSNSPIGPQSHPRGSDDQRENHSQQIQPHDQMPVEEGRRISPRGEEGEEPLRAEREEAEEIKVQGENEEALESSVFEIGHTLCCQRGIAAAKAGSSCEEVNVTSAEQESCAESFRICCNLRKEPQ